MRVSGTATIRPDGLSADDSLDQSMIARGMQVSRQYSQRKCMSD